MEPVIPENAWVVLLPAPVRVGVPLTATEGGGFQATTGGDSGHWLDVPSRRGGVESPRPCACRVPGVRVREALGSRGLRLRCVALLHLAQVDEYIYSLVFIF